MQMQMQMQERETRERTSDESRRRADKRTKRSNVGGVDRAAPGRGRIRWIRWIGWIRARERGRGGRGRVNEEATNGDADEEFFEEGFESDANVAVDAEIEQGDAEGGERASEGGERTTGGDAAADDDDERERARAKTDVGEARERREGGAWGRVIRSRR